MLANFSPWGYKDPLSRALHNLMVTYLLTEAHSGYDLPFMSHRLFPGVFGGPVAHEQHHQQGGGCRPPHTKHQTPLARQHAGDAKRSVARDDRPSADSDPDI